MFINVVEINKTQINNFYLNFHGNRRKFCLVYTISFENHFLHFEPPQHQLDFIFSLLQYMYSVGLGELLRV